MLLVDEPTAQLDTRTSHSVSHVLGNLAGQGMIVLVATHDPDTRNACDRVIDLATTLRKSADLLPNSPTSQSPNRFPQSQRMADKNFYNFAAFKNRSFKPQPNAIRLAVWRRNRVLELRTEAAGLWCQPHTVGRSRPQGQATSIPNGC